ncbi:MAG: hypothetical protein HY784_18950 [Chloroflexi bacterium]|nr:hypothetical protein [Chloroflexota bacterium]
MNAVPLQVEVIAHVLGSMDHCSHCQVFLDGVGVGGAVHQQDMDSFPPEWMQEWQALSDVIFNLTEKHAGRLVVKITDAQSPQGMWAALRRGVRQYPTFMVSGEKYTGLDQSAVDSLIGRHLPGARVQP